MGCHVSSDGRFEKSDFDDLWKKINQSESGPGKVSNSKSSYTGSGWKILRIILVTTFKDFRNERNAVLEMIENRLQPIANDKKVFVQLEDFNFGSKAHLEEATSIYVIEKFVQIAKIHSDFCVYVHFLGECSGYQIDDSFTDHNFLSKNRLSIGQTISEVFLQLIGIHHQNSIFLHRDPGFLDELPFNMLNFIDGPSNRERAIYMAEMIKRSVSSSKFFNYSVRTSGINNTHFKHIQFVDLTSAIIPIESLIETILDDVDNPDETISKNQQTTNKIKISNEISTSIEAALKSSSPILIHGDYSSGKSTLLRVIFNRHASNSILIECRDGMSMVDVRKEVDTKIKVKLENVTNSRKSKITLLIDNLHLLKPEDQANLLRNFPNMNLIATSRKIDKNETIGIVIPIREMDDQQAISELAKWLGNDSLRAATIIRQTRQELAQRRKSVSTVEDGVERRPTTTTPIVSKSWTFLKCRVIAKIASNGSSDDKCAKLAQYSTIRVVEADISLMESDSRGHLLIATLSYLSIIQSGLTELELRALLADELTALPLAIHRSFRNLPFDYCADQFGSIPQIAPLRWWFIVYRLEHLLNFDVNYQLISLSEACQRVSRKKFLRIPQSLEHFKKRIRHVLIDRKQLDIIDTRRRNEIIQFL